MPLSFEERGKNFDSYHVNIRSLPDSEAGPGVATAERPLICLEIGTQAVGQKQGHQEREDKTLCKVFLFGISQT